MYNKDSMDNLQYIDINPLKLINCIKLPLFLTKLSYDVVL